MQVKKNLAGLFLFFLFACNSHVSRDGIAVIEFPLKKEIKTAVILTDSVILAPDEMFIYNDQIWILQKKKQILFDVFSLPDGKYLYSKGTIGQGPNEFIFPVVNTIQTEEKGFTVLDVNVLKTVVLQPDSSLRVVKSEKTFNQIPVNGFVKLNDSLLCAFADCATGTTGEYEYCLKNLSDGADIKFSEYPDLTAKKFEGDERCRIYYKYLVANANERKFAAFYSYFKFFRIFSFNGELLKEIRVNVPPYRQTENIENWEEREVFYGKPLATEKYIYARCHSNEIQVWDWEGNPVIQYITDKEFFTFAVFEKDKKIYMVSAEESDLDKIYVFDMLHF